MNDEILHKYWQYLCGKYRKKNTRRIEYSQVKQCLQWINKPVNKITKDDLIRWKSYIVDIYKPNGNARRVSSVNHFLRWIGREDLKLSIPKQELANKIILSDKELQEYIDASKENPLWYLIAVLQIDGLLRPGEIKDIKIQNIDFDNQRLYLDDTKTGNNYIIMSHRVIQAIKNYMPYRNPLPKYKDYLIIVPDGKYKGQKIGEQNVFIRNVTAKIALKAGIRKRVTPYIIKPSAITNDFNKNINPRIIQRKARHKNIETTLRYDHTDDEMVRRYFERQQLNIETLNDEDKTRLMLDRFLSGEIDLETLKQTLDFLHRKERSEMEISYA